MASIMQKIFCLFQKVITWTLETRDYTQYKRTLNCAMESLFDTNSNASLSSSSDSVSFVREPARDEKKEVQKIAANETRNVRRWRRVVVLMLFVSGSVVTYVFNLLCVCINYIYVFNKSCAWTGH
jgi:hypothetical protein